MAPEHKVSVKCLTVTFVPVLVVMAATGHYNLQQWISGLLIYAVAAAVVGSMLPTVIRARWRRDAQRKVRQGRRDKHSQLTPRGSV